MKVVDAYVELMRDMFEVLHEGLEGVEIDGYTHARWYDACRHPDCESIAARLLDYLIVEARDA